MSCKVMYEPRSRNTKAPNGAIYPNMIVICQPLLSQKIVVACKLCHNMKSNDMIPMPTLDWNITFFTVVFESEEAAKTAYKRVNN